MLGQMEIRGAEIFEEKRVLAAVFSHDLRTALAVLKGYMELLEMNVPKGVYSESKVMEVVNAMSRQVGRLGSYVEDMGVLQKLEDVRCRRRKTDMAELAGDLRDAGRILCEGRRKAFFFSMEERNPSADAGPTADRELIAEVFGNLVSNAARFAEDRVKAVMKIEKPGAGDGQSAGLLTITVTDDGPGFGEEALRQAAMPFYSTQAGSEGHQGLGLYICKVLCEKHGGNLSIGNARRGGGQIRASFLLGNENGDFDEE